MAKKKFFMKIYIYIKEMCLDWSLGNKVVCL